MESATPTRTNRPRGLDADTMAAAFQITVEDNADTPAIRTKDDEFSITWAEYAQRVESLARGLAALGLERGGTIGIMLTNRPEFHVADSAALHLGAAPFSVYNTYTADQIEYLAKDAGNSIFVTEKAFLDTILAVRDKVDGVEHVIVVDGDGVERHPHARRRGIEGRPRVRLRGGLEGRRARRPAHRDLHLRHHRPAQGRAAHPRQPRERRAGDRGHHRLPRGGPRDLLAALRPHRRARLQPLPADRARLHHHRLPGPAPGGGLPARGAPHVVLRRAAHLGEAQGGDRGRDGARGGPGQEGGDAARAGGGPEEGPPGAGGRGGARRSWRRATRRPTSRCSRRSASAWASTAPSR